MIKDTFKLCYDRDTGMAYVKKVQDELTKNHKGKDTVEIVTGFMPQILDADVKPHRLCPVRSFENYIGHFNEMRWTVAKTVDK